MGVLLTKEEFLILNTNMKYRITVIGYDENKNYEKEMAEFKANEPYNKFRHDTFDVPQRETAEKSLEVILTEEEYKKVKAEVIKIFE